MKKKIILTIIDGLGMRKENQGNAFNLAKHKTFDYLFKMCPNSLIEASGKYVGLPENQIGNSEVGHLTIGAGRVVYTGLSLINNEIQQNTFKSNKTLLDIINHSKNTQTTLHIMGLLSNGGVHSLDKHLFEILDMCFENNLKNVSIHIFGDGRDVAPQSINQSLKILNKKITQYNYVISSIAGRFYAMDRDKIFSRNQLAYDAMLGQSDNLIENIDDYIQKQYSQNIFDEFFVPAFVKNSKPIKDNDSIIFFNFRPDRTRQLSHLFLGSKIYDYEPKNKVKIAKFVSLMKYEDINTDIAFKEMKIINPLGEVLANNNIKQLRLAETQKYAHVTYFFNGGKDILFKNESRILVDSIKAESFADYPHMSAQEITDVLLKEIKNYDFIIVNYANPDMVGHTGNLKATIKAIEFLDQQFARILNYLETSDEDINWFITADHGNAEITEDINNQPATKHTTSPVMLISYDKSIALKNGTLADIAPTILDYLNIKQPKEMNAQTLITKKF
ncbi:2,3-bisphosphoglycerate-independent phosphoglycerate mutase [Mycoplasma miroungirhinis]|uniref:2,3-bisphosphoglycerate-independent phosphoglycerate mutase n=1 Tax=Mycoplasma miroungirhinis TaxID=754516 RepID=A0A6M4JBS0_9MOLU|nr:2,3-bisphosphoglycerate-independent phosphoglycerate mutase [Mycoplasma miroungirhinis]QJR44370.1 2,3-bisphosphoglycerate-independent phosphoglycerate mutase [Mycoplasma miroungirhinis]